MKDSSQQNRDGNSINFALWAKNTIAWMKNLASEFIDYNHLLFEVVCVIVEPVNIKIRLYISLLYKTKILSKPQLSFQ